MEAEARNPAQPLPAISWETLEKSLVHPNALIREKAIETAARLTDPRIISALQSAVRDDDPRIRTAAAQAFANLLAGKNPEMEAALSRLISSSEDAELRRFLISQIPSLSDGPMLRAVITSLVDAAPAVRSAAETALQTQGGAWLLSGAASDAVATIEAARQSSDIEVRASATNWSENLRRAQVRRTMLDSGVASILTLTNSLRGGSAVLRAAAAWALQQTGDARAVPALVEALRDSDESVRRAAAVALASLHWRAATEEEHAAQLTALGRWEAAVKLGPCGVDALILAATQSSPSTQALAVKHLAGTKSVRAILPLQDLLNSPHPTTRAAAALGLKALEWVPPSKEQALTHAIELEDWESAAALGAEAVAPLMSALKNSHGREQRRAGIARALGALKDAGVAKILTLSCRDGEVAAEAVRALSALLEHHGSEIASDVLDEIASLSNVVQFQFTLDSQYQRPVRSGLEIVSLEELRELVSAEQARRSISPPEKEAT